MGKHSDAHAIPMLFELGRAVTDAGTVKVGRTIGDVLARTHSHEGWLIFLSRAQTATKDSLDRLLFCSALSEMRAWPYPRRRKAILPAVRTALTDSRPEVVTLAADELARCRDEASFRRIGRILCEGSGANAWQYGLAKSLAAFQTEAAYTELIRIFKMTSDENLRRAITQSLSRIETPQFTAFAREVLAREQDKDTLRLLHAYIPKQKPPFSPPLPWWSMGVIAGCSAILICAGTRYTRRFLAKRLTNRGMPSS